jgi:hypothetical protein
MFLLTRQTVSNSKDSTVGTLQSIHFGATEAELCEALNYTGKHATTMLKELLYKFSQAVGVFGLVVRQNVFTKNWFVTIKSEIQEFFQANPFLYKKRVAATLCTVLLLALTQGGSTSLQQVQEIRQKKDITDDIDELIQMQFIQREGATLTIDPNLAYYLDLDAFIKYMDQIPGENSADYKPDACLME